MHKLILGLLLSLMGITASAQIHWDVNAGVNILQDGEGSELKAGVKFGGGFDYHWSKHWSTAAGLNFSYLPQGDKDGYGEITGSDITYYENIDISINPWYLELPVTMKYRYNFTHNFALTLGAGPQVAVGLGGKGKITETPMTGMKINTTIDNVFKHDTANRWQGGFHVDLSAEFLQHYVVTVGYSDYFHSRNNFTGSSNCNVVNVGLGYRF